MTGPSAGGAPRDAQRAALSSAGIPLPGLAWEAFKSARGEPATAASCPAPWLGNGRQREGRRREAVQGRVVLERQSSWRWTGIPGPNSVFAPARRSAAKKPVWGEAAQPSSGALRTDQVERHKAHSRHDLLRMIAVNSHEYSAYGFGFAFSE